MSTKKTQDINSAASSITTNDIKYSKSMLAKLYNDYKAQNLQSCDIEIVLNQNEHIFTHKIILKAHSNFFRNMIEDKQTIIELNDPKLKLKLVKLMLRYFYKGTINMDSKKYLKGFKNLAKKLEVKDLYKKLSEIQNNSNTSSKEVSNMINDKKSKKMAKIMKSGRSKSKKKSRKYLSKKNTSTKYTSSVNKRNSRRNKSSRSGSERRSKMSQRRSSNRLIKDKHQSTNSSNSNIEKDMHPMTNEYKKSKKYKIKTCS